LLIGYVGFIFYLSASVLVAGPNSSEEERIAKVWEWSILGPLWATLVFLFFNAGARGRPKRRVVALSAALVAWAIVGLTFNLLVDWEGRIREEPKRANCLSYLKQIGLAIAMYADEYQGRCPMDSTNPTLIGSMQLLSNVLTSSYMLRCPSDSRPNVRDEEDWRKVTPLNISYSYVPNLLWQSTPDSALALDRIYSTSARSLWPSTSNHKEVGGNILFNDGHVAWANMLPVALKDKDGRESVLSP
jgi:prepilin-type processing-associated H-X9-DG protein